jgi:predicted DNA-binding antitoxin AbrB/MazE fold protein
MLNTIRAVVRKGKIELLEKVEIPEGTEVLVTPLIDEPDFWLKASESSLDSVWDNSEDDVYAELLEK